jgi:hypothetical protein
MSDKQLVLERIRDLPESVTIDQIGEEILILAKLRRAEEESKAGLGVPAAEVRAQLASWLSK